MKFTVTNINCSDKTISYALIITILSLAYSCSAPESNNHDEHSITSAYNYHYVVGINLKDCVSCHANFWNLLNAISDRRDFKTLTLVFNNERQVEIDAFIKSTPLDIPSFCKVKRDPDQIQKILSDNGYAYFTTFLAVYDSNQDLVFFKTLRGLDDLNSIPGMNSKQ